MDDTNKTTTTAIDNRAATGANLVRIAPHKHWWRVTRVYVTPEERAQAAAHARAGDIHVGFAYGGGRLASRGWRKWDGREQLEVGDEVYAIELLRDDNAFMSA